MKDGRRPPLPVLAAARLPSARTALARFGRLGAVFSALALALCAVEAEVPASPGVVRLAEGQRAMGSQVASARAGTLLAWVQGKSWDRGALKACPVLSLGADTNKVEIDAAGASVAARGQSKRLDLPVLSPRLEHVVAVRWNAGKVELWLDARAVASVDGMEFEAFAGELKCASPTKDQASYRILGASLFSTALSDADMAAVVRSSDFANDPLVVVPLIALPPAIDGKLSENEWHQAAVLSGLHQSGDRVLAQTQGLFMALHDTEHLYVAYRGGQPGRLEPEEGVDAASQMLWQAQESRDSDVGADDSLDLVLVPGFPAGPRFRFQTNHSNTHRDYRCDAAGQIQLGWEPKWKTATGLDGRDWIVEASIPWDAIPGGAPKPGAVWGMNFRRIWRWLQAQEDEWATGTRLRGEEFVFQAEGAPADSTVGRVQFAGKETVATRILKVGGFERGSPTLETELVNLSAQDRQVRVHLESNCGEIDESRELVVPAQGKTPFAFSGKLTRPNAFRFSVTVEDANRGALLHRSTFYFQKPPEIQCSARYFPSADRLELEWDLSQLRSVALERLAAEVHFVHRATNKVALSHGIRQFRSCFHRERLGTSGLPAGDYVAVALVGRDRQEIGRTVHPLSKKPAPEWLGNRIGLDGQVPPPFEPVRVQGTGGVEGRKIHVVGRTYDFGRSALPDQVYVADQPILAAPLRLLAERTNERVRDIARDMVWGKGGGNPLKFDLLNKRPDRMEWQSQSLLEAEVRPGISGWAEYDGLLWFKVQVRGENWSALRSLRLEIPLRKEWATLLNNFDRGLVFTGALPKDGIRKRWEPVWLGNERGGLQWVTESTVTWRLREPEKAVEVIPRQEDTLLRVTFIDHEVELLRGFQAEFGLIATPVRPAGHWNPTGKDATGSPWACGDYEPKSTDSGNPLAWPVFAYGQTALSGSPEQSQASAGGPELVPQAMLNTCRAGPSAIGQAMAQVLDTYSAEWAASRRERPRPGPRTLLCSPASKSWQDFLVWTYAKMHERKRYTGLYIHDSLPVFSDNWYAGGGAEEGGQIYPKWTLLGAREMLKRLYAMLRLKEPKGSIRLNLHGRLLAPLMGFCDMVVDGEGLDSKLSLASPAMFEHLSPDTFRAQYLGANFGPFCWWTPPHATALEPYLNPGKTLAQVYPDPDREARWLAGMALVHRAALNPAHVPGSLTGLLKALGTYGLPSEGCRFVGYWSDPPVRIDPPREGVLISAYMAKKAENPKEPAKVVLVVLNNTDWEGDLRLSLAWDRLDMAFEGAKVEDVLLSQPLRQENGRFLLPVKRRNACLIGVRTGN